MVDLTQEGQIRLPTTPADISRLGLAYAEAAVAICDAANAALAEAGGRGSPAVDDERQVPPLYVEAQARGRLGVCLAYLGERQRGLELLWQAVALKREVVRAAEPGCDAEPKSMLAGWLCNLGALLKDGSGGMLNEAEACLREALELCEETDDVRLKQCVLTNLANMSGQPDQPVGPTEAAALRSRLNTLYAQNGRVPDTSCTICLELLAPLEQPGGSAEEDADADRKTGSCVHVLPCGHQFHHGCLVTWWRTQSKRACPLCKKKC